MLRFLCARCASRLRPALCAGLRLAAGSLGRIAQLYRDSGLIRFPEFDQPRFDAGARYTFERSDGKPLTLRFNVENFFGQNYWASATANYGLAMGAPRTFLVSLSADF